MPYDEIVEGILRVAGRALMRFFVEVLFETVGYLIGKPVVRLLTLGRYPEPEPSASQGIIVSTAGLLVLLAVPFTISWS